MEYLNFMCLWLCFTGRNLCYYMTPISQLVSVLISCIFQTPQMMGICCVPAKMTKAHVKMKRAGENIVFITGRKTDMRSWAVSVRSPKCSATPCPTTL